jgi:hypothetical protein
MHLRKIGWDGMDWIDWLRIGTSSCEHGNEPLGSIKYWETCSEIGFLIQIKAQFNTITL